MDRLLRFLLVVVTVLSLLLLADYFDLLLPGLHMDAFASAAGVIFGIAPSSLFLMILVNYAMGTADLVRVGALVHRSRSVESLAQATVICFAQAGILTGTDLEMELDEAPPLAASRIRQILGAYARSTSVNSPAVRAIAAALPLGGPRYHVRDPGIVQHFASGGQCPVRLGRPAAARDPRADRALGQGLRQTCLRGFQHRDERRRGSRRPAPG